MDTCDLVEGVRAEHEQVNEGGLNYVGTSL